MPGFYDVCVESNPVDIEFAGFRTTSLVLQRAGWRAVADQDLARMAFRLSFHHPDFGLVLLTEWQDIHHIGGYFIKTTSGPLDFWKERPVLRVRCVVHERSQVLGDLPMFDPVAVDMRPSMNSNFDFDFEKLTSIFRPIDVPEEKEIIVGPQNVQQALDLILEMQKEDQATLRQKARDKARRVHAQVVSLAA